MALVDQTKKRTLIPHERDQWMDFRVLSWRQIKEARQAQADETLAGVAKMPPEILAGFTSGKPQEEDQRTEKRKAAEDLAELYMATNFSTAELLGFGIAGWSYNAEVTDESIGQLDEATAMWAKNVLLDMTKPPSEVDAKKS